MALTAHPRKFTLHVTEIEVDLADEFAKTDGNDDVDIVFHGKVLPTTKDRIVNVLVDGAFTVSEKRLA